MTKAPALITSWVHVTDVIIVHFMIVKRFPHLKPVFAQRENTVLWFGFHKFLFYAEECGPDVFLWAVCLKPKSYACELQKEDYKMLSAHFFVSL